MQRFRFLILFVVVLALSTGVGYGTEPVTKKLQGDTILAKHKTVFVVIVPPDEGSKECRIVPWHRVKPVGVDSMTIVNLCKETVRIEVPANIADTTKVSEKMTLAQDESWSVKLRHPTPREYIYSIEGPVGGCLTGLPNPRIVIP